MSTDYFLAGIYMVTFAASGLFFLKFYRASGDRFFQYFCIACWLIATERILRFVFNSTEAREPTQWTLLFRLAAFVFIIKAIYDKNKKAQAPAKDECAD